jgi:SynChlorMet cassette protein ScmD
MNFSECYYIAGSDVVLREEMDNWALLFDPNSGQVVGINPVGIAIWKMLDGQHNLQEIARVLESTFDNVPGSMHEELSEFCSNLIERGFIGKIEK